MTDQRQTDAKKWSDKWFKKLNPDAKLVFLWLTDNVDHGGFIELDLEDIAGDIGWDDEERAEEALLTLSKGKQGSVRLGKGKEPYVRVLIREGHCWLRNKAKVQCTSYDLRLRVAFERGCVRLFLQNKALFPEPLEAYTCDGTLTYPSLGFVRDYKNKDRREKLEDIRTRGGDLPGDPSKPRTDPKPETEPKPARAGGLPYPPEDASEIERWKGQNEHYDAMTDGGVRMRYDEFKATARLAGAGDDLNWAKVVEKMIWKQGTGELTKASGYMASLIKSPDFKLGVEEGGLDENGRSAAWHEQASQINKLYSHHKISADGVREMHEQHRGGVDHDMAAYDRGEGPLQAEFPMDKPEEYPA